MISNDKYRNTDKPIMEDSIYDMLMDWLEHTNPKSKLLKEIGAKVKLKNKVALDYWLGSMDKIKSHNKIHHPHHLIFLSTHQVFQHSGYYPSSL